LILAVTSTHDNAPQPVLPCGPSVDSAGTAFGQSRPRRSSKPTPPKEHTVHTQSPTITTDTAVAVSPNASRGALRTGSTLLLGGLLAEYVVTSFHAAHENPNDHDAVFAEYAASDNWIAVHLGQFAAGLVVIAGIITLLRALLRPTTGPALFTRVAEGAAILTASMIAVLQGIDGFTLKHAVDSLAASPPDMHDAAFHDAEIVRWIEWAAAGYFRVTLGLTVVLLSNRNDPGPYRTALEIARQFQDPAR
jgi:hypothetical protein